ncbi:MAG: trypsin-like peptidase domain-containing protein [Dehalococcoidia bacterium]|nr:trypsin-like peptidase domain-containing protein [Dehalococcoidia bacterium]
MRLRGLVLAVVVGVLIVGSAAFGAVLGVSVGGDRGVSVVTEERAAPAGVATQAIAAIDDLPALVDRVKPSVVQIQATTGGSFGGQGVGTGIMIDRDGNILTNYHVIEGAQSVTVDLTDGTQAPATVVGTDPGNDLAVLRAQLPSDRIVPATLGDSDSVRVGEPVFAIGNPFGLAFTVTSGIISGRERERSAVDGRPIRNVIQTDAAVNPGNSGGPLFNARGEVVGINTSIENPTGQRVFVGIGFAVPSNTAKRFLPQLVKGETPKHPQLGISGVTLDATIAQGYGVSTTQGVYLTSVGTGSPAAQAGLRASGRTGTGGDVITAIDGRIVRSIGELAGIIDSHAVGDTVKLTVQRGRDQIQVDAVLREWQSG